MAGERGFETVMGEIGVVEVVVADSDEGAEDAVGLEWAEIRQVGMDTVVGVVEQPGLIEHGGGKRDADGAVDVKPMELRDEATRLVLFVVDARDVAFVVLGHKMLAAIVVGYPEIGEVEARIGARDVYSRVVA